jgi:hypothetical protein
MGNLLNKKDYNPSNEHTGEQIREITSKVISYQPDNYELTWGRLSNDLFRFVTSHWNLKRDIMPLLCVCKKMTIKVLRELRYVTGQYPDANSYTESCSQIKLKSTRFDSYPLWISYASSWWRIFKDPCPIHRLIINLKYKGMSLEPLLTLWDLSSLDSLVIRMSKIFDQDEHVSVYGSHFDLYQLPSLKEIVLLDMYITPETWDHLSPNLEFIQLVNCQLGPSWNINLRTLESLLYCLKQWEVLPVNHA